MARNAARLKMSHFPLPEPEARKIRSLLSFPGPCSVVDPCAGKGTALNLITAGAPVVRLGVELDTARAEEAAASGIRMIQGNTFDAQAKVESFSLLYLNPPYDSEIDLSGNRRMERLFLGAMSGPDCICRESPRKELERSRLASLLRRFVCLFASMSSKVREVASCFASSGAPTRHPFRTPRSRMLGETSPHRRP